jgi:hypothetical protein
MLIEKTELVFDHKILLNELNEMEEFNNWGIIDHTSKSFAVTSRNGTTTDGAQKFKGDESEFKLLSIFKDTYTEEVINSINIEYGRVRFLYMKHQHIMKIHKDPSIRYHIPLITNQFCGFLDENLNSYSMNELGRLYKLNATNFHSAFNCSRSESRIHLVIVSRY